MGTVDAMIAAAQADVGYREGAGKDTKFGRWYGLNGEPWCDMAVSYWGAQSGNAGAVGRFAYCPDHVEWFHGQGRWVAAHEQAHAGDLVFYDWDGDGEADHIGLLVQDSAAGADLATVEGNTSSGQAGAQGNGGGCYRRQRGRSCVLGFGRPEYVGAGPSAPTGTGGSAGGQLAQGDHGQRVQQVQQALIARGYGSALGPGGADGDFGPRTAAAVRAFQQAQGIAVDGVVGPVTLGHLGL
ncbi:peptidoglycan-binding domain-containing protein [Kitasatospora sp. LaBMicrA B282]|uniref:peptidoglycan-binding domain-containing protein n=1 Tax=Kitasatospora sp. LaBMicrA B282 TaxID=3420949 RepID=UPI003D0B1E4D